MKSHKKFSYILNILNIIKMEELKLLVNGFTTNIFLKLDLKNSLLNKKIKIIH